ncbi:unnamed protein product [Cochlearia groenlandica]
MDLSESPSFSAVGKRQTAEDAICSTAEIPQPPEQQSPSREVDSVPVSGSSDDAEFDQERNIGEDRDQDRGDDVVEIDVVVAVPVDEMKQKIIRQVEYYFSDENLPTDKFLLTAIKKTKKGFVPIATIATFNKMKKLTRDHALIVSALKESSFLVVSQDGKKVKRLSPLPEIMDPKIFTVLVENLPEDHSDENIREIFGKAGSIKSVSICDPSAAEQSEKGGKKEKFISTRLHAFVEYETMEAAEKAATTLNNDQDWRNGMRVKLFEEVGKFAQRDKTGRVHGHTGGEEIRKANEHQHHRHNHTDTHANEEGGHKNGNRGAGRGRRQSHQGGYGIGHGTTPSVSSSSHHNHHHHHVDVSKRHPGLKMSDGTRGSSSHHSNPVEVTKRPPGPKMPDGTRGFTMGRGKPLPPPTYAQNEL